MRLSCLHLQRHGVDIAEAPLEGAGGQYRAGAGGVVKDVGGRLGLVDRVRAGKPDRHQRIHRHAAFGGEIGGARFRRLDEKGAGAAEPRVGAGDLVVDGRVFLEREPGAARTFLLRQRDERLEHAARDAEGDGGEADRVDRHQRHAVQGGDRGPLLDHRRADNRALLGHEQAVAREPVAAGAAQPDGVPTVGQLDRLRRDQRGPVLRHAPGVEPRSAVVVEHRAMRGKPGRVVAAAREAGPGGDAVAALDRARLRLAGAPGQHARRVAPPDLLRQGGLQEPGERGASVALGDAPGGAAVVPRDRLDDGKEDRQRHLGTAISHRQKEPEQRLLVERSHRLPTQPTGPVGLGRERLHDRPGLRHPGEPGIGIERGQILAGGVHRGASRWFLGVRLCGRRRGLSLRRA